MIAFSYYGGKQRLAADIIDRIPHHDHYCEPYAGSLAVLLNKAASPIETVNDLNSDITNFFLQLRDNPERLIPLLELTVYARDEFELSWQPTDDLLEKARRFFVRVTMDVAKAGKLGDKSFSMNLKYNPSAHSYAPANFFRKIDGLHEIAQRLRNVQIENRPAVDVIRRADSKKTFFYLDPPYVPLTRTSSKDYFHEMSVEDHLELYDLCTQLKGKVMISGYDDPMMGKILKGWHKHAFPMKQVPMSRGKGRKTQEILWMNYNPAVEVRRQLEFEYA